LRIKIPGGKGTPELLKQINETFGAIPLFDGEVDPWRRGASAAP
jgi:hypothetical protein